MLGLIAQCRDPFDGLRAMFSRQPPMRVFVWNSHILSGDYARGVLMAVAPDLETARRVAYDGVYRTFHVSWSGYKESGIGLEPQEVASLTRLDTEKVRDEVLSKEPEVFEPPFGFYQRQVD